MPRIVLAVAAFIGLAVFRLGRVLLGAVALWMLAGPVWSVLALASLLLFRWSAPIRLGILLGAVMLLHWWWIAAALLAAPRLLLMLPGYLSTLIARIRHPRPLWRQPVGT